MLMLLVLSWCVGGFTLVYATSTVLPASFSLAQDELNCSSIDDCPQGLVCSKHQCKCVDFKQLLRCGENSSLLVLSRYCLTYKEQKKLLMIGLCIFPSVRGTSSAYAPYHLVHPGKLNETCAEWNRGGVLCGRCQPGFYPLAYSYNFTCIHCSHPHWNWVWYIVAAYLPLTLFYFFILFFKVKIMSSHMSMAISVCQALSFSGMVRWSIPFLNDFGRTFFANLIFSLYGIWNLDFFRPYYSNFSLCLDILPTLALDYVIAVYPLFLIVVSYLLITLYDRNYRVVIVLWSPFRRLFALFRNKWDIKTSVIDSFATFFFLSNIKLFCVSFDLLVPTNVYHFNGISHTSTLRLLYSADIEFLGKEHLPYAVLALTVSTLFVLVPIILLSLYPFKFFQRFLNLFPFRWYILRTFMDSFLGCYKDGTQPSTRDCRCFLGIFLLVRVLLVIIYNVHAGAFPVTVLILIVLSVVVMAVRPFKTPPTNSNLVCAAYILLLAFIFSTFVAINSFTSENRSLIPYYIVLAFLAASVPLVDAARVLLVLVVRRRRGIKHCVTACCWRRGSSNEYEELPGGCGEGKEGVSDRILYPEAYPKANLSSFAAILK